MSRPRKQTQEQKYEWMRSKQEAKAAKPMVVVKRQLQAKSEPIQPTAEIPRHSSISVGATVQIDTFNEKQWKYKEAADHLAISKGTLKRLTLRELAEGVIDIGTLRIGPKEAHTLYTYTDSALRRIHNRMMGGYYGRPRCMEG